MKKLILLSLMAAVLVGCDKKDDGIAKKAGEVIGQQVTDFTKGVGRGIDQTLIVQVSLSSQVQAIGLTNTIAKSLGTGSTNSISVYLIASQSISNTLIARALNADSVEVGRAKAVIFLGKNDAAYITFTFGEQMDPGMVKRYEIGL